ncbi:MAG: sugar phosphate isomerase/epimerase [Candidatus Eiseniibacteriota bacterium]|nr:MAG: sugar phosphate isomerase/epimerase [Candidatus Eisenbacteria bacterium]
MCDTPYRRPLEINTDFLKSVRKALGIEFAVHSPFNETDIGSLDDSHRERSLGGVLEAVELGHIIGASVVVVHPAAGSRGGLEERDRVRGLEKESLQRISEFARSREVKMCIENMPAGLPFAERSLASGVMQLVRSLDWSGVTFDVGHANTTTVPAERMLEHFGPSVTHVHVHDNQGSWDQHLEIGLGNVNWKAVIRQLVRLDYRGILVDESFSVEAARRGVHILRRVIEEVQALEREQ